MKSYETGAYRIKKTPKNARHAKNPAPIHITGGEFRGRELKSPLSPTTHPMGSRERLALFNSLSPVIKNAVLLDAFAGTGALGFEALSRGAAYVTFVEKNHKAADAITANIGELNVVDKCRLLETKVESLDFEQKFDIVLADPPYNFFTTLTGATSKSAISTLSQLSKFASRYFVLSHPAEFDPHSIPAPIKSTRAYASARITIFDMSQA